MNYSLNTMTGHTPPRSTSSLSTGSTRSDGYSQFLDKARQQTGATLHEVKKRITDLEFKPAERDEELTQLRARCDTTQDQGSAIASLTHALRESELRADKAENQWALYSRAFDNVLGELRRVSPRESGISGWGRPSTASADEYVEMKRRQFRLDCPPSATTFEGTAIGSGVQR